MSIIERVKNLTSTPIPEGLFQQIIDQETETVRLFLGREIDRDTLFGKLSSQETSDKFVTLPSPGSLGGLFLKIADDFGQEINILDLYELLDEERAHYEEATKLGIKSSLHIFFVGEKNHGNFRTLLSFEIPSTLEPETARTVITRILQAPSRYGIKPGPDDLAKLQKRLG